MLIEYDRYSIATHWVIAIEYGDYSGLEDDEIKTLEEFLEGLPRGYQAWQWSDDNQFSRDAVSGLMADCVEGVLFTQHADL